MTHSKPDTDVAIIGGGPAGASMAAYLAKAGVKCVVLESELFPRPHVGESLVPSSTRVFQDLDFLKVMEVGVATFVDWGGAWYNGSKRRTGWDTGIGLRLGPSRATDIDLSRIDLVYRGKTDRDPAGWLIVIGRGLVFSTNAVLTRN